MASFTFLLPRGLPTVSSSSRHVLSRTFASSSSTRDGGRDLGRDDRKSSFIDDARRNGGFRAAKDKDGNPIGREGGILYRQWLEGEGRAFKNAKPHKTNWLGGEVPFPLNPSFKPPPPLSDALRNQIFARWKSNPEHYNPRMLSIHYNLSIKRIEAIIRLKAHEAEYVKEYPLQTAFAKAFESATGVYSKVPIEHQRSETLPPTDAREDAAVLDYSADWEQLPSSDVTSVYWEPVNEGEAPIVPTTLEKIAQERLSATHTEKPPKSVSEVRRTTFVDVGSRFQHTHHSVKKSSAGYKGPQWTPEFTT
ncbi:hypothetical protein BS47DRAFT_1345022 [Hydnum rufescens UP504]|uniref:Uncharacterized protein n=1 Tax=Hydnum rufescens UP504 TaxID=1448309 RepID=A0A9P6AVK1_9AGAM|nr:hypothetical protein BS47DRAFT_1345022 [Hydnum rufescens UP504]